MSSSVSSLVHPSNKHNANNNLNQRESQQTMIDSKKAIPIRLHPSLYEGYSSVISIDSRYLNSQINKKWKYLIAFMYSEPSIMFYSNVFLMICSAILMFTSDKYVSNLDITRTFLKLESNKPIFISLCSGFVMFLLCVCGLYAALTIRRKLCYYISGIMIISALFQCGLGIRIINRKANQEIMVRKEMKSSFLSYNETSRDAIKHRWDEFQTESSCCGLHGANSYRAKNLPVPDSCTFEQHQETNSYVGCFDVVKQLEEKFLNPVIILTFFCSFLQMSNGILILNLLRPKPKPRRYHIACINILF